MLKCSRQYALRRRSAAVCLKPCYRPACAFPHLVKRSDRLRCGRYSWTQPQTVPSWQAPRSLSFNEPVLVWPMASSSAAYAAKLLHSMSIHVRSRRLV